MELKFHKINLFFSSIDQIITISTQECEAQVKKFLTTRRKTQIFFYKKIRDFFADAEPSLSLSQGDKT
jgi:hypothetical protein